MKASRTDLKKQKKSDEVALTRKKLRERLSLQLFGEAQDEPAWFSPLTFFLSDGVLSVRFPHQLFFRWFSEQGQKRLEAACRDLFGNTVEVRYTWGKNEQLFSSSSLQRSHEEKISHSNWDDFFPGGRNRDSVTQFRKALSLSPSVILLHGPSGTGKSHLISAAAEELRSRYPSHSVRILSGQNISFFLSLKEETFEGCAAFLIDDVHLLSEDAKAQRALASLIDALEKRAFFITTMIDQPSETLIPELYDRLCSHLVLELMEPDLDVRMRFALLHMERAGLPENRDLALLLSRQCLKLRPLSGIIASLKNLYVQRGRLPSSEEVLALLRSHGAPQPLDAESIIAAVASHYGCTSKELIEKNRNSHLSIPRQAAMYLCRELLGESYPSIGLIFGGRDHSTIMYAIKKIEKIQVMNNDAHMVLTEITKQLKKGRSEGAQGKKSSFPS